MDGVLRNSKGEILFSVSKYTRIKESNEVEESAILEALRILSHSSEGKLIVESGSSNAVS